MKMFGEYKMDDNNNNNNNEFILNKGGAFNWYMGNDNNDNKNNLNDKNDQIKYDNDHFAYNVEVLANTLYKITIHLYSNKNCTLN